MAINNPIVTDADIIQDTAVAIQEKDHGGKMEAPDIPSRIRAFEIAHPPVERKDVNLYTPDGNRVYSYTFQEAANLISMPEPPTFPRMVFQGWTLTLEIVKSCAEDRIPLDFAAIYNTDDNSTRFYFYNVAYSALKDLTIGAQMEPNASATIDWGDGTTGVLENNTNKRAYITATKTGYEVAQEDRIVVVSIHGEIYRLARSGYQSICFEGNEHALIKVEIGSNCKGLGDYAFNGNSIHIPALSTIFIADGCEFITGNSFRTLNKLKALCFPNSVTRVNGGNDNLYSLNILLLPPYALGNTGFDSSFGLTVLSLPFLGGKYDITGYSFRSSKALNKVYIPNKVSGINMQAFAGSNLRVVDLSDFADPLDIPTLENANAFPNDCIYLFKNQEMLTAFTTATNWSACADRFQIKPSGVI